MTMESYTFMDCDQAIKELEKLKKKNKNCKVLICTVDFDNDRSEERIASPEEGCKLIQKSETIIFNNDKYVRHMQLFSKKQESIENLLREGIMHDILLGNYSNTYH